MQISLIQVPYMVGDDRHSASDGPQHLLQNGAANIFTSNGFTVSVDQVERGTAYRDSATASLAVNKNLKKTVQRAVVAEQVPIVLAGSCDVSAGILAGFDHSRCGVVWLDAHGDFNTPESTISGFFAGMSLAVITGHCYRSYWAQIGDNTPVLESATVIFGVRDLDPAEQQRFQQSQIRMVKWRDGNPRVTCRRYWMTCLSAFMSFTFISTWMRWIRRSPPESSMTRCLAAFLCTRWRTSFVPCAVGSG